MVQDDAGNAELKTFAGLSFPYTDPYREIFLGAFWVNTMGESFAGMLLDICFYFIPIALFIANILAVGTDGQDLSQFIYYLVRGF